jgi:hypothetical protein
MRPSRRHFTHACILCFRPLTGWLCGSRMPSGIPIIWSPKILLNGLLFLFNQYIKHYLKVFVRVASSLNRIQDGYCELGFVPNSPCLGTRSKPVFRWQSVLYHRVHNLTGSIRTDACWRGELNLSRRLKDVNNNAKYTFKCNILINFGE